MDSSHNTSSKRTLSVTFQQIEQEYGSVYTLDRFYEDCKAVASKCLIPFLPSMSIAYEETRRGRDRNNYDNEGSRSSNKESNSNKRTACTAIPSMQVFGIDLMLDDQFNLHVLELNNNPSLSIDETFPLPTQETKGNRDELLTEREMDRDALKPCTCREALGVHYHQHSSIDEYIKKKVVAGSIGKAMGSHHCHDKKEKDQEQEDDDNEYFTVPIVTSDTTELINKLHILERLFWYLFDDKIHPMHTVNITSSLLRRKMAFLISGTGKLQNLDFDIICRQHGTAEHRYQCNEWQKSAQFFNLILVVTSLARKAYPDENDEDAMQRMLETIARHV